jgi:hypothetical protein
VENNLDITDSVNSKIDDVVSLNSKKKAIFEFIAILLMFLIVNLFSFYIAWHSPLDCEPYCQEYSLQED